MGFVSDGPHSHVQPSDIGCHAMCSRVVTIGDETCCEQRPQGQPISMTSFPRALPTRISFGTVIPGRVMARSARRRNKANQEPMQPVPGRNVGWGGGHGGSGSRRRRRLLGSSYRAGPSGLRGFYQLRPAVSDRWFVSTKQTQPA